MKNYLLGVDLGSGSVKLTLLHRAGEVVASVVEEYPTHYPQPGWAEQHPEDWCAAFKAALQKLLAAARVSADEMMALAPDAATHTAVLLDESCRPLCDAILWTDQRSSKEVSFLKKEYLDLIMGQTLHAPTCVWTLPQMMWLKAHRPEVWQKTRHLLFAKDYLRFRLTGELMTDTIEAMGSMFYDCVKQEWSKELCAAAGIDESWLPQLRSPTDVAGVVTKAAAREFGLCEGTPVLVGATDTVLEQLAAGSVAVGHGVVKLATAGRICIISDHECPSPYL
ncbi:MAG: xylulokinase, partial [Clostridia bacterium]|nr:xylulokinase [Clostridia bacterium]